MSSTAVRRWAGLASNGYDSSSLDAAINGSEDGESALADFIGTEDAARAMVDDFHRLLTRLRGRHARHEPNPAPAPLPFCGDRRHAPRHGDAEVVYRLRGLELSV